MTDLAKDIGLEDDLITNQTGQSYILLRTNCILFQASIMGIPTDIKPFLNTFNFPLGKLRAGLDLVIPPIKIENDISVGEFFRKRLGNEMLKI